MDNTFNREYNTAVHQAVLGNRKDIVEFLLQKGSNAYIKNIRGNISVHLETELDNNLCSKTSNFSSQFARQRFDFFDSEGDAVIHVAARRGLRDLMKLFLRYGFNINTSNAFGQTPIHRATHENRFQMVELLLENGADPNIQDNYGKIPLHTATEMGWDDLFHVLLKFGTNTNTQDADGNTPLHLACKETIEDAVLPLLRRGANFNIENSRKETVFDLALQCKEAEHRFAGDIMRNLIGFMMYKAALGVTVNPRIIHLIDEHKMLSDFRSDCIVELEYLKFLKIVGTAVTFFDLLTKNTNILAGYVRNLEIGQCIEKYEFRIYGYEIQYNYTHALHRRYLLDNAKNFLIDNAEIFSNLPVTCVEHLLQFLENEELEICITESSRKSI